MQITLWITGAFMVSESIDSASAAAQNNVTSGANSSALNNHTPVTVIPTAVAAENVNSTNTGTAPAPKVSLVAEGLRIAQQYGMSEFAHELMKSIPSDDSDSDVDAQEEWNREIEKDMIQQKLTSPQRRPQTGTSSDAISEQSKS